LIVGIKNKLSLLFKLFMHRFSDEHVERFLRVGYRGQHPQ
jgi:hypothetical protein